MNYAKPLLYLWAFPGTCVGLLMIPLATMMGGHVQVVDGVLEAYGGALSKLLKQPFWFCGPIAAITLGHVVLGDNQATLEKTRKHERVHVRQYELWGPFFIPAYLLAGCWVGLRGGNPYRDNPFEVEAYAVADGS